MNEVYINTYDLAKFVRENYFNNKDFITLEEFYRAFEELDSDYEHLKEEYDLLINHQEEETEWE